MKMTTKEKANEISEHYATSHYFPNDEELAAYDAAMQMAEWKERQMIDKTCEWLEKNITNYIKWEYNEFHQCVEYDGSYDIEKMISDFRKSMEE